MRTLLLRKDDSGGIFGCSDHVGEEGSGDPNRQETPEMPIAKKRRKPLSYALQRERLTTKLLAYAADFGSSIVRPL